MFTDIEEAISWVTSRRNRNIGFHRFKEFMEEQGNPQDSFHSIHIAGTNGKGSTANYLSDILRSQGYRVGLYTSPHLINHRDRIRLNGEWIPEAVFLHYLNRDLESIEAADLSMFEIDTLIASQWYKEQQADYAVIETGLGGRLDSTNVIHHPDLEIITTIGFDHMDRLGDTLREIAGEKAGIIKSNSTVLIGHLEEEALSAIRTKAEQMNARIIQSSEIKDLGTDLMIMKGNQYRLAVSAYYEKEDAAMALEAASFLGADISSESVKQAVRNSMWPGRFEQLSTNPLIIADGAHNPEGMTALMKALAPCPRPLIGVFSALKDKQGKVLRTILESSCDHLIVTEFSNSRADTVEHLKDDQTETEQNWQAAINEAVKMAGSGGTVIITGSLYLISLVRPFILKHYT
ncbi:MAG: bifunctional folylpolyglutamate synthase/dihydrofolate synthase [Erysipelotrichia bacterium]|nr:bifunctional folylpolyglutamate synthase/dihydrofolate synthase [Erysipelotrichia bacterium]